MNKLAAFEAWWPTSACCVEGRALLQTSDVAEERAWARWLNNARTAGRRSADEKKRVETVLQRFGLFQSGFEDDFARFHAWLATS